MLPVTFLSDYGLQDEYVGVCHGVIRRIAPDVSIIDLTHEIAPRDIRAGALSLRRAIPYMPEAVHLAVVDPGVGTQRRPLALRCANRAIFVGPDNGLLWPAAQVCGGIESAAALSESGHISPTFHGRDLFAPVAAALALDPTIETVGTSIRPEEVMHLDLPQPVVAQQRVAAHVFSVDRFGNVALDATPKDLEKAGLESEVKLCIKGRDVARGTTFGDVGAGEPVLYEDSSGSLAIALNGGDAANWLKVETDDDVLLTPCR